MVGDSAWDRLSEAGRRQLRADGPALVADMLSFRGEAPFDVLALRVPVVFGRGGPQSRPHHRQTTAWLAANVPGATLHEIAGATHGAHLSHPDGFCDFVRATIAAGPRLT
jgi:pimeloyl-ACP methyl ester carboxylesterase